MTANQIPNADREQRLDEIVADYLRAVDQRGPQDPTAWVDRHPDFAIDLREFFADEGSLAEPPPIVAASIETSRSGLTDESVAERVSPPAEFPETFGRYRILRRLGQGAMGAVYLAHDTQLDRQVALKTPSFSDAANDARAIERFQQEAKSAATLQHANICPVHDVGAIDGTHFITMAFVEGRPLSDAIDKGKRISQRQAANLVRKIAIALDHAHGRGVIHRDLKPANIMIDERGEPVVMDFGLARRTTTPQAARITRSGQILGTPAYMPPEQVETDADNIGPASDVYSLGVIFYELLTGQLPFDGSVMAVIGQILTKEPDPPSAVRNEIDPRFEAICLQMMAKKLDDRCPSMKQAADELAAFLRESSTKTVPASSSSAPTMEATPPALQTARLDKEPSALAGRSKPRRWKWAAAAALGAALLATVIILLKSGKQTIKVEIDEQLLAKGAVTLSIDGGEYKIAGLGETITLKPGEYSYKILRGDQEIIGATKYVVKKDGKNVLTISLAGANAKKPEGSAPANITLPGGPPAEVAKLDFDELTDLAVMPDGRSFVFRGGAQDLHFADLATAKIQRTIRLARTTTMRGRRCVAVSPDGRWIATDRGNEITVLDVKSGESHWTKRAHDAFINDLAISPQGTLLASAGHDKTVKLWDLKTGEPRGVLQGHGTPVVTVKFSRDGRLLASGASGVNAPPGNRFVRLWNVESLQEVVELQPADGGFTSLEFTPDGKWLIGGKTTFQPLMWNVETGALLDHKTLKPEKHPNHNSSRMALSNDGRFLFVAGGFEEDRRVFVWDIARRGIVYEIPGLAGSCQDLELTLDVRFLVMSRRIEPGKKAGTIHVWRLPILDKGPHANSPADRDAATTVLSIGGTVEIVIDELNLRRTLSKGNVLPPAPFHVTAIDLSDCSGCKDEHLARFDKLTQLARLDLSKTSISREGLHAISGLKSLRQLHLGGVPVTDLGLVDVAKLTSLEELSLRGARVTDVGLKQLTALTNLQSLSLGANLISGQGLRYLAGLKGLRLLDLGITQVTDESLKHLEGLSELADLNLDFTAVTDAGAPTLSKLKKLQRIQFSRTRIGDKTLEQLAALTDLRELGFDRCAGVTDRGLKHLESLTKLEKLILSATGVTDAGMPSLAKLTNLKDLGLYSRLNLTDEGLAHLKPLAGNLESLNIGTSKITDAGVAHLAGFTKLTYLCLDGTNVTDDTLQHLTAMRELDWLRAGYTGVTEAGAQTLKARFPGLAVGLTKPGERDRVAAEWALSLGGKVTAAVDGYNDPIALREPLPESKFLIHSIDFENVQLPPDALRNLRGLRNIEILRLPHTGITGADLESIAILTSLHSLELGANRIGDEGLKHLSRMEQLTDLHLNTARVTDEGLLNLQPLGQLESLTLTANPKITHTGIERIVRYVPKLQRLYVGATGIDDASLADIGRLAELTALDLQAVKGVTDTGLKHLSRLPKLKMLNLFATNVTDAAVDDIARIQTLEAVNLTSTKVTAAGAAKLRKALPNCKISFGPKNSPTTVGGER